MWGNPWIDHLSLTDRIGRHVYARGAHRESVNAIVRNGEMRPELHEYTRQIGGLIREARFDADLTADTWVWDKNGGNLLFTATLWTVSGR